LATKKAPAKTTATKKIASNTTTAAAPVRPLKLPATKMTKTQLVRFMAEHMSVTPKQVNSFLTLLVDTATAQTKKLGEFTVPGLGKLVKAQRAARMGRNPATGEPIKIKAKTTIKFRVAKAAKDAVVPPKA
jgi:DNA-binding protein HU-beta